MDSSRSKSIASLRDLFEEPMADEKGHTDFLETQLDLVKKLGLELYARHHIGEMDED